MKVCHSWVQTIFLRSVDIIFLSRYSCKGLWLLSFTGLCNSLHRFSLRTECTMCKNVLLLKDWKGLTLKMSPAMCEKTVGLVESSHTHRCTKSVIRRRPFFESYLPFTQFTPYFPGMHFSHAVPVKLAEHWQCPFPDIPSPHWPLLEQGLLRLPGQANIETILYINIT